MTYSRCRTHSFLWVSLFLTVVAVFPASARDLSQQKQESVSAQPTHHLALDENTKKPVAMVEYEVRNAGTNQLIMDEKEKAKLFGAIDGQLTLQKSLPMSRLAPGEYQLTVKVTDLILGQTITSMARFAVD